MSLVYFSAVASPRKGLASQQQPRAAPRASLEAQALQVYDEPAQAGFASTDSSSDDEEFYMNVEQAAPLKKVNYDYDEPPPRPPRRVEDNAPSVPPKRDARPKNGERDVTARSSPKVQKANNNKPRTNAEKPRIAGVTSHNDAKPRFAPKPGNAKTLPAKPSAAAKLVSKQRPGERQATDAGEERKSQTMPGRFGKTMLAKRINQFNQ